MRNKIEKILNNRVDKIHVHSRYSKNKWDYIAVGLWILFDLTQSIRMLVEAVTEEVEEANQIAENIGRVLGGPGSAG